MGLKGLTFLQAFGLVLVINSRLLNVPYERWRTQGYFYCMYIKRDYSPNKKAGSFISRINDAISFYHPRDLKTICVLSRKNLLSGGNDLLLCITYHDFPDVLDRKLGVK